MVVDEVSSSLGVGPELEVDGKEEGGSDGGRTGWLSRYVRMRVMAWVYGTAMVGGSRG